MACRCRCVGDIVTADTTCINLGGVGSFVDPLTATPIIDAVLAENVLSCSANGLAVPGCITDAGIVTTGAVAGPAAPGGGVAPVDLLTGTINLAITNPSTQTTMLGILYIKQRLSGINYGDCDTLVDATVSINGGGATAFLGLVNQPAGTLTGVATDGIEWTLGDHYLAGVYAIPPSGNFTVDIDFNFHWVSGAWNASVFTNELDLAFILGIPQT